MSRRRRLLWASVVGSLFTVMLVSAGIVWNAEGDVRTVTFATGRSGDRGTYQAQAWDAANETWVPVRTLEFQILNVSTTPDQYGVIRETILVAGSTTETTAQRTIRSQWTEWVDLTDRRVVRLRMDDGRAFFRSTFDHFDERLSFLPALAFQSGSATIGDRLRITPPMDDGTTTYGVSGGAGQSTSPLLTSRYAMFQPTAWRTPAGDALLPEEWVAHHIDQQGGRTAMVLRNDAPYDGGPDPPPLRSLTDGDLLRTELWLDAQVPYPVRLEQHVRTEDGGRTPQWRILLENFEPGEQPIPWGRPGGEPTSIVQVQRPVDGMLPTGVGSSIAYPFEDAFADATENPSSPAFLIGDLMKGYTLVAALAMPGALGAPERESMRWYFWFDDGMDEWLISTERIDGVPAPIVEDMGRVARSGSYRVTYTSVAISIATAETVLETAYPDGQDAPVNFVQWGGPARWQSPLSCPMGGGTGSRFAASHEQAYQLTVGRTNILACQPGEEVWLETTTLDTYTGQILGAARVDYRFD